MITNITIEADYLHPRIGKLLFTIDKGNNYLTVEELVCILYKNNNCFAYWTEGFFWDQLQQIIYSKIYNLLNDGIIIKYMYKYKVSNTSAIEIFFNENFKGITAINKEILNGNIKNFISDDSKILTINNIILNKNKIIDIVSHIGLDIVVKIIYDKIINYSKISYFKGMPDLLVYNKNNERYFIEVKSENDHIFLEQKNWHKYLNDIGAYVIIYYIKNKNLYLNKKFPELLFNKFNFNIYERESHIISCKEDLFMDISLGYADSWITYLINNKFYDEFIIFINKIESFFIDTQLNELFQKKEIEIEKQNYFNKLIKYSKLSSKKSIISNHIKSYSFIKMINLIIEKDKTAKGCFLERIADVYYYWDYKSESNILYNQALFLYKKEKNLKKYNLIIKKQKTIHYDK